MCSHVGVRNWIWNLANISWLRERKKLFRYAENTSYQPARGCFVPPQNLVGGGYRWQMGPVTYKRHSQFSVHICREDIQLQAQKQLRMAWLKITLLLFVYLEGSGEIIMILLRLCITKWFFFSMLQWGLLMMTIPPAALTSAFNVNGLQDVSDAPRAVSLWYFFFL